MRVIVVDAPNANRAEVCDHVGLRLGPNVINMSRLKSSRIQSRQLHRVLTFVGIRTH